MGFPSPAQDYVEDRISLDAKFIAHPHATYFMRAGLTHYREGIIKGALLVVDSSLNACDGSLLVCCMDGEFKVKRYRSHPRPHLLNLENGMVEAIPTSYDGVELEWVDATDTNDDGTDKKAYIRLRVDATSKQILEEGAVRPNKIQLAGCRNKDQAMNRAQLEARRLIYQRTAVDDIALSDANIVQLGDCVRWADVYDEAVASGEILKITGTTFTTSESLIFDAGVTYKVSITDQYGYPSQWITAKPVSGNSKAFQADFSGAYTADNINSMLGSRFILTPSVASDPMDFVLVEKGASDDPSQLKISLAQYDDRMFAFD